MKQITKRYPFTFIMALAYSFGLFLLSFPAGCKKDKPLEYPPPPPNVLIETPTRPAQAAGAAIGKYIPYSLRSMPLRIIVVPPAELFRVRAKDRLQPIPGGVSGIVAYCQMPENRPEGNDGVTRIYLSDKLREEDAARTSVHELGHSVYYLLLTDGERWDWIPLWGDADKRGVLPSEYAKVSASEGFAETFRVWIEGGLKLKDPALNRYFSAMLARLSAGRMLQPA